MNDPLEPFGCPSCRNEPCRCPKPGPTVNPGAEQEILRRMGLYLPFGSLSDHEAPWKALKRVCQDLLMEVYALEATRYAWLIENGKGGNELRYRSMDQGQPTWTTDPNEALNFSRREDAERFSAEDEDAWRIVEHGFEN